MTRHFALPALLGIVFALNLARAAWSVGGLIGALGSGHPWNSHAADVLHAIALAFTAVVIFSLICEEADRG